MAIVPTDDIVALLQQDHEALQERLLELENSDPSDRTTLFRELRAELTRHEVAEGSVVYPSIRNVPGGDRIADACLAEESESEDLLARTEELDPTTAEFVAALRDLRSAVRSHAANEETHVFPLLLAQEEGNNLALLGQKFRAEKLGAPTHPHSHLLPDPAFAD